MDELEMAVASDLVDALRGAFNFEGEEDAEEGGFSVDNVEVSFEEGVASLAFSFQDTDADADEDEEGDE